jgi:hypothetical protein
VCLVVSGRDVLCPAIMGRRELLVGLVLLFVLLTMMTTMFVVVKALGNSLRFVDGALLLSS